MRQLSFFPTPPTAYGGELHRGKRKSRRPLSTDRPVHLVLKSAIHLFPSDSGIEYHCRRFGGKFRVRIYGFGVAADHIHFVIRIANRRLFVAFLRSVTGILARIFGPGLWSQVPYTRIATWGREFKALVAYCERNRAEAASWIPYEARKGKSKSTKVGRPACMEWLLRSSCSRSA